MLLEDISFAKQQPLLVRYYLLSKEQRPLSGDVALRQLQCRRSNLPILITFKPLSYCYLLITQTPCQSTTDYPCFLYVFGITKNTSNYRSGSLKVIPLILPLEEDLIQPEHYPNQSDNQQSNEYWDNQIRHASSAC